VGNLAWRRTMASYTAFTPPRGSGLIKAWVDGVPVEQAALDQLTNVAQLPFIHKWVAAMPDMHAGICPTGGSVIPTRRAPIPAAEGVDVGCGAVEARTTVRAADLPDSLAGVRAEIEAAVPHGRTNHGGPGDRGAWGEPGEDVQAAWVVLRPGYERIIAKYP